VTTVRRATSDDLAALAQLYHFLHPTEPVLDPQSARVQQLWREILADPRLRYYFAEVNGAIASTCTLTLIPNFTRGMRSYGVIENVVTAPEFRQQGCGTRVLRAALADAWAEGCYKVMLSTGSQREETLRFYENAGFKRGVKTGFVAYPG
jgi:ribosomal protein S18 acetylase RimI-like enzyme